MTLGATALQAFGGGMTVFLVHHLEGLLVQGEYKNRDKRNARLFWIVLNSVVGMTTLL
jgi:ATP:corrinoid adenosyltransferase